VDRVVRNLYKVQVQSQLSARTEQPVLLPVKKDAIPLRPHAMECGDASNISINWMDMVAETRSAVGMYDLLLATSYF
jgi:hypothetical protein